MDLAKLRDSARYALERLSKNNEDFIRAPGDEKPGTCIGYVEALVRIRQEGNEGAYQYVAFKNTPGKIASFDGNMSLRDQRKLIDDIGLVAAAQGRNTTFRLPQDFELDNDAPFDSVRLSGELLPNEEYALDATQDSPKVLTIYDGRYQGKSGPHVGPAINLIAFMMVADLDMILKDREFQEKYLGQLLGRGSAELSCWDRSGSPLATAKFDQWCSSVPDVEDPKAPPIALIYTIAQHAEGDCLSAGAVKIIHRNTIAAAFDCFRHYHEREVVETWGFATGLGLARATFSKAVDGEERALLEAWADASDRSIRQKKASDLIDAYVRKAGGDSSVAKFIFSNMYLDEGSEPLGPAAKRREFLERATEGKHVKQPKKNSNRKK